MDINLKKIKNYLQSIKIEIKDNSGEKTPFVSVGITRVVLLFLKFSNFYFKFMLQTKVLLKSH